MSNIKEVPDFDQVVDNAWVSGLEPHIPPPIPDPTGIALLLFAIIGVSEIGYRTTRGKA